MPALKSVTHQDQHSNTRLTRQGWRVLFAGSIASMLILASVLVVAWESRARQVDQALRSAVQQSLFVAEQAHLSIKSADLVLRAVSDSVAEARIYNEDDFINLVSTRDVFEKLRQRAAGVPQIDAVSVLGLDGEVLNFSRWFPAVSHAPPFTTFNLKETDYVKAQMADADLEVYVGAPTQSSGTGAWTFHLSRKIRNRDGVVLGIGVIDVHVSFFANFYKSIGGNQFRNFTLLRDDGVLLARYPPREDYLARSLRQSAGMTLGLLDNADHGAAVTSKPRFTDPSDTRSRIVAPRRVRDYPLLADVVVFEEEFLADWREDVAEEAALALALVVLTMTMTIWLARLMSRQSHTMRELEVARIQAESATRAKTEFLAMMSHEIRTPINAIIGMSDALQESMLPPRERSMARIVSDASAHLLTIVNTILDFSALESGHEHTANAPFELRRMVRQVMAIGSSLKGASNLALLSNVASDVPDWMVGDQGHITQVLINLMSNAVKFTEQGRVTLNVTRVTPWTPDGKLRLRFTLEDTGPGIDPQVAEKLFEPFERGVDWLVQRRAGTGLGLAICKRLVALMGGSIGAQSEAGSGSVFWFELAVEECPPVAAPVEPPLAPASNRPRSILVAEDSESSQLVARHFLESMGHTVTIAADGRQALEAVQKADYDLVLMDGHMPVMSGLEATRAIRALGGKYSTMPIYGLSANVLSADREKAKASGMDGYLTKPVRKIELAAVISRL